MEVCSISFRAISTAISLMVVFSSVFTSSNTFTIYLVARCITNWKENNKLHPGIFEGIFQQIVWVHHMSVFCLRPAGVSVLLGHWNLYISCTYLYLLNSYVLFCPSQTGKKTSHNLQQGSFYVYFSEDEMGSSSMRPFGVSCMFRCGTALGAFMCIRTPNTGQLISLFHTFAEFRPTSGLPRYNSIYYWFFASVQFSPNKVSTYLDVLFVFCCVLHVFICSTVTTHLL